jgi:Amt family ammonium transporter
MPLHIDSGDTAWVLASSALVLLMTPGLAFFYGGMVRVKSVLNLLMMSAAAMAIVTVLWVLYGYSLAFTPDVGSGLLGSRNAFGLAKQILPDAMFAVGDPALGHAVPETAFVAFQLMFAIITVALISGAIADRAKFSSWCVFVGLWATIVYFPVAHWVFYFNGGQGGWIGDRLKALDFAGGTAVHINSGAAGLALCIVLGKRRGWRKDPMRPHNMPLVFLGSGLLWFGWFGFNAGSALAGNNTAGVVFINTQAATAAAIVGWLLVERLRDGHFTTLGAASGAVAGLVAITPACNTVNPMGALALGLIVGGICAMAISLKYKLGYDDSLDVVGVHMIGGLFGTLLIGLFATATAPAAVDGLFYGGGFDQLGRQAVGAFAVMGYSFVCSLIIGYAIHVTLGFRISEEEELTGVDVTTHAEGAYELTAVGAPLARHGSAAPVLAYAGAPAPAPMAATASTSPPAPPPAPPASGDTPPNPNSAAGPGTTPKVDA